MAIYENDLSGCTGALAHFRHDPHAPRIVINYEVLVRSSLGLALNVHAAVSKS